jgi:hypothetical protein
MYGKSIISSQKTHRLRYEYSSRKLFRETITSDSVNHVEK